MAVTNIDHKKIIDSYRAKPGEFRIVEVSCLQYLMIDGHGDLNTSETFQAAIAVLYPIAYGLKFAWHWTLMIMQPDWIPQELFRRAKEQAASKAPSVSLDQVRLESPDEGRCAQTLHIGSFDHESNILARMHDEFIPAHGLRMVRTHHEISLSDVRRAFPENLRTILRQPVEDA